MSESQNSALNATVLTGTSPDKAEIPTDKVKQSYLYLAKSRTGYLKAGVSLNPRSRIKTIPFDLRGARPAEIANDKRMYMLHFAPGGRDEEQELHRILSPYRVRGTVEWYTDCPVAREIAIAFINKPVCPKKVERRCPHCHHELTESDLNHIVVNPDAKSFASSGGVSRAKSLTAKQRKEIAKKAAEKRWADKKNSTEDK